MLEKDRVNIFAELRKQNYINTKKLKSLGLNNYDINKLIKEGKLVRVANGYYSIKIKGIDYDYNISKLKLARKALNNKEYDKVFNILNDYIHLNTSKNAHYILFQTYMYVGNYEAAKLELLKSIELSNEPDLIKENDLYMINQIIELEEKVKKLCKINKSL